MDTKLLKKKLKQNKYMRRSGQTTRLVDRWVQEFFNKGIVYIYEGRDGDKSKVKNIEALNRFIRRMESEHSDIKFEAKYGEHDRIHCFKVTKIELPKGVYLVPAGVVDNYGNLKQ